MDPQTDKGVEPEIAPPVEAEPALAQETQAPVESDADRNWRAMRESQEQLRQEVEREKFKRQLLEEEFAKRHQAALQVPAQEPEDELSGLSGDDWLTKDQYDKLSERRTQAIVEQSLAKERAKRAAEELPSRIKSKYQDFDAVVSEENVTKLKALEPEIAAALGQISDPYAQAVAAYKYIKTLVPSVDPAVEASKQRIADNSRKPGSAAAAPSPLSQAGAYERGPSAEEKARLYQEMVQASRR